MSATFKRALDAVNNFAFDYLGRYKDKVFAIIVFGSLAKGTWRKTSDVDVILLPSDCSFSRDIRIYDDLRIEVYKVPARIFLSPFHGNRWNLFFDMFRLQALRNGRALYDRNGSLSQICAELRKQRISLSYFEAALRKALNQISVAEKYIRRGRLADAELKIRDSSMNIARALLLKINEPEINTPKLLIPHIREKIPKFYRFLREVYGLNGVGRSDVESEIEDSLKLLSDIGYKFGGDWRIKNIIEKAKTEILNAKDCFEIGDYDSAMLQIDLSQSIIMKNLPANIKHSSRVLAPKSQIFRKSLIKEYAESLKEMVNWHLNT